MEENTIIEGQEETQKTFTEQEVNDLLQRETDRRVSEAMKKASKKQEEAVKAATKLAQMGEQEKFQYELEQRENAIADKERQLALMDNKAQATKILAEKGLSIGLVDFVVTSDDADVMMGNIKILEREFKKSVSDEVTKRLKGNSPIATMSKSGDITKEQFRGMSLREQSELYTSNKDLYMELIKQ